MKHKWKILIASFLVGIGIRASYDSRGDADFYDWQPWVYNSQ